MLAQACAFVYLLIAVWLSILAEEMLVTEKSDSMTTTVNWLRRSVNWGTPSRGALENLIFRMHLDVPTPKPAEADKTFTSFHSKILALKQLQMLFFLIVFYCTLASLSSSLSSSPLASHLSKVCMPPLLRTASAFGAWCQTLFRKPRRAARFRASTDPSRQSSCPVPKTTGEEVSTSKNRVSVT